MPAAEKSTLNCTHYIGGWRETKLRKLKGLGLNADCAAEIAYSSKGSWRLSLTPQLNKSMGIAYWLKQGLMSYGDYYSKMRAAL